MVVVSDKIRSFSTLTAREPSKKKRRGKAADFNELIKAQFTTPNT